MLETEQEETKEKEQEERKRQLELKQQQVEEQIREYLFGERGKNLNTCLNFLSPSTRMSHSVALMH